MSVENAAKLLQAIDDDPALKQQVKDAGASGFQQVAAARGLDCTHEELLTAAKLSAIQKLSDPNSGITADTSVGVVTIGVV